VLLASVVHDPEVRDLVAGRRVHKRCDAAATIPIDHAVDDKRGRSAYVGRVVVRLVKDNPVAVAVMKTLIHFPNNDAVGDHVMKAVVGIRPGDVVVGDSTGPTTSVATGWDVTIMI